LTKHTSALYLSVVIPAFNEEDRLGSTLDAILQYLHSQQYSFEIILVDDGSRDRTIEVATTKAANFPHTHFRIIKNASNHGKGYVVRQGMLAAKGSFVLFCDADLATPIETLSTMLPLAETDYDIVFASRAMNRDLISNRQPLFREISGKVINFLVQMLYLPGIKDSQCGFKLFRKNAAQVVFTLQKINGWVFDIEALWLAKKLGFTYKEVPAPWKHVPDSRVKTSFLTIIKIFTDLLAIRTNHRGEQE